MTFQNQLPWAALLGVEERNYKRKGVDQCRNKTFNEIKIQNHMVVIAVVARNNNNNDLHPNKK